MTSSMFYVGPVPETKEFSNGNALKNLLLPFSCSSWFQPSSSLPSQVQIIIIDVVFVESCCTVFEETSDTKLIEIQLSVLVSSVYWMHRVWQNSGVC